jgi:hypothetical protein
MAKGLIIHDRFGAQALRYYQRFPEEPGFAVQQPQQINHISLDNLLQAIIDASANKTFEGSDLVLAAHGNERGLTMRLFPAHRTDSRSDDLETLMSDDSTAEKAAKLFLREAQVDRLIDKMNQVRGLNLGCVEFRGCNIGPDLRNVSVLKGFLGAASVSGPDLPSTFGAFTTQIMGTAQMDLWLGRHPGSNVYGGSAGRLAFHRAAGGIIFR